MVKTSLIVWICWFALSFTFYGISFGVASLSGNLYLNIFLLSVVELPVRMTSFYLNNKFGRKRITIIYFFLSAVPSLGCVLSFLYAPDDIRGTAINVFCLVAKLFMGSAWSNSMIWTSELYPTVVRQLGYAWASLGARIGGFVGPIVVNLDEMPLESYVIITVSLFVCTVICYFLDETNTKMLPDSMDKTGDVEMRKTTK